MQEKDRKKTKSWLVLGDDLQRKGRLKGKDVAGQKQRKACMNTAEDHSGSSRDSAPTLA